MIGFNSIMKTFRQIYIFGHFSVFRYSSIISDIPSYNYWIANKSKKIHAKIWCFLTWTTLSVGLEGWSLARSQCYLVGGLVMEKFWEPMPYWIQKLKILSQNAFFTPSISCYVWLQCHSVTSAEYLPALHAAGQALQSLYGVTIQSRLHGSKQGLTVSGRRLSGHLEEQH